MRAGRLALVPQKGHWCHTIPVGGWLVYCSARRYPVCFCYSLNITLGKWMGWKEETIHNFVNVFVMFCRYAYSLLENHIV